MRHPANPGYRLDFETDDTLGQCKLGQRLSLEELPQLAEEMKREALPKFKDSVVVVKRRRGPGRGSPLRVVMTAGV